MCLFSDLYHLILSSSQHWSCLPCRTCLFMPCHALNRFIQLTLNAGHGTSLYCGSFTQISLVCFQSMSPEVNPPRCSMRCWKLYKIFSIQAVSHRVYRLVRCQHQQMSCLNFWVLSIGWFCDESWLKTMPDIRFELALGAAHVPISLKLCADQRLQQFYVPWWWIGWFIVTNRAFQGDFAGCIYCQHDMQFRHLRYSEYQLTHLNESIPHNLS